MTCRSREEVEAWRQKDPIPQFRAWLLGRGYLSEMDDERLVAVVRAKVSAATEFARQSPWLAPEAVLEDVYASAPLRARGRRSPGRGDGPG